MLKKLLVPFLILALFMVVRCDKDDPTEPDPVDEFKLVADVGDVYFTSYTTTSGAGVNVAISAVFDSLMANSNAYYIIDYRSGTAFADGHIKNAHNFESGLDELVANMDNGTIPTDKKILNVCYTGQNASAATALLNLSGYEAYNLLFGMCAVDVSISGADKWQTQIAADERAGDLVATVSTTTTTYDFPTLATGEEEAAEIMKDTFAASGWTISANDVWDNPANYFIINYWPEADYLNPGHIPGAYQFTPKASLKYEISLNLLPTDKTIVIYCYTGQTSAQVATYLRMLGYDAKSLLYGVNGFAYTALAAHKYAGAPTPGIYDAILVK